MSDYASYACQWVKPTPKKYRSVPLSKNTRMTTATMNAAETSARRAWPMRLWLAAPDWFFRVAGAAFFFAYFFSQAQRYWHTSFAQLGPYCEFPNGTILRMPWVPILIDITFLLIAVSFCFRIPPRTRVTNGWIVVYSLLTGFAPLIPIWLSPLLGWLNPAWQAAYDGLLWRTTITWQQALAYGVIMTIGFVIEVWGYAVLFRSLSIVPEPRELKIHGPYRFVRHPIYFGQFFAQAGVWLVAARMHWVSIGILVGFIAMQLYRSKLEDRVLEDAFGQPYREWKEKTFWFV